MNKNFLNNLIKLLVTIIVLIVIIFIIKIIYNAIILNKLSNLAKEKFNSTNYSYNIKLHGKESIGETNAYVKDSKYLVQSYASINGDEQRLIGYGDEQDTISIMENNNTREATINGKNTSNLTIAANKSTIEEMYDSFYLHKWTDFGTILSCKISSEKLNDKNCYFIQFDDIKLWIEKDTGIVMRSIHLDSVSDYSFSFNDVTDNQIVKPDISDFNI